jgi:hypothetical protein
MADGRHRALHRVLDSLPHECGRPSGPPCRNLSPVQPRREEPREDHEVVQGWSPTYACSFLGLRQQLTQDEPKWIAHNRGHETDVNPFRVEYLKSVEVQ